MSCAGVADIWAVVTTEAAVTVGLATVVNIAVLLGRFVAVSFRIVVCVGVTLTVVVDAVTLAVIAEVIFVVTTAFEGIGGVVVSYAFATVVIGTDVVWIAWL